MQLRLGGKRPEVAICDRGFKGKSKVSTTKIVIPKSPKKELHDTKKQRCVRDLDEGRQ